VIFIYQKSPGFKPDRIHDKKNLGLVIRKDRNFSIGSNNGFAIRHTNYNVLMSD
jgi:hypothetical protein